MAKSNQNVQNEVLYRFHPAYGFIEANSTQATGAQAGTQQSSTQQNIENPNFQNSYNPYANPYYAGVNYSPYPPYNPNYQSNQTYTNAQNNSNNLNYPPYNPSYCPPNAPYCPYPPNMAHMGHMGMGYHAGMHGMGMGYHAHMQNMPYPPHNPYNPYYAPYAPEQGFSQERIDAIYNTVNDVMNGKAEPTKLFGLFQGTSSDFWKGLAIAAGAVALYNCSPLKDMLASTLATFFGENMQQDKGFDDEKTEENNS